MYHRGDGYPHCCGPCRKWRPLWVTDREVIYPRKVWIHGVEGFPVTLTQRIRYRRLGKLRVTKSGHDTVEIDPTNVRQFTMNLENDSPMAIDVEGQVVNRDSEETFIRFRKDEENLWRVR